MPKLKQISVFLENSPGRLYAVTKALGDAGINLRALSLVDTAGFGVLRLLVSDVAKARRVVMGLHLPARIDEVVAVEIPDRPGSLAAVLEPVNQAGINVEYMYAFTGFSSDKAVMVFRFSDNDQAIRVLGEQGVRVLDAQAFGMLESA
ncbi:ACT domain-containing protein [Deferrisoma camini]|uniref:ACT domain-containing protein n=1 Tax=Deferrisoma camini TaxID=1035120 RepID=UPI00046CA36D|nr:ACT domain-containing protein [Deferrisoma camini]NOY44148.1 amino acid-binding protein [Deltaproteobacteria bacterium]